MTHARRRRARVLAMLALAVVALPLAWRSARAEQRAVDLQLVLAVDVSGSVDATRFELQRRGYAEAFADPRVGQAIRSGPLRAIAVTMVQWTGPALQTRILDWRVVEDEASARAIAAAIAAEPRRLFRGGTSISGAIDHAMGLFAASPYSAERRVIDVSGDGANNSGRPAPAARDDAVRAGVVINGLPILALERDLDAWYRDNVIGGPGSFVIAADGFETFGEAILDKLVAEIAGTLPPLRQAAAPVEASRGRPRPGRMRLGS